MKLFETAFLLGEKSKHVQRVLQQDGLEVVNIQLQTGEKIAEHSAPTHVLIVVRQGKVLFTVDGQPQEVTTERILFMEPGEKHSLEALEDVDLLVLKTKLN